MNRRSLLEQWITADCGLSVLGIQPMPGDASFRQYFRVQTASQTVVAMDAPPPQENCAAFIAVAKQLRKIGLHAPEILAADVARGFLLITDFGDVTYLKKLNNENAGELYQNALSALSILQRCHHIPNWHVPFFTAEWMWQEWALHKEWFLDKWLGLAHGRVAKELDACYAWIVDSATTQPQVLMHRDYHSANLMLLENNQVGILDFQDAFIGPMTYDVVSLLRDCYIDWPEKWVTKWALDYWERLPKTPSLMSAEEFLRLFDWMGIQRHLKALLTFSRKSVRDHQPQYLKHVPRTLNYLLTISGRYPELAPLHHYFHDVVSERTSACVP